MSPPRRDDGVEAIRFDAPRDLRAVLFIPELRLSTDDDARRRCRRRSRSTDAVANLGAVAVGVAGLATGRYDLLARLTVDRLHEPYRAAVYPQLPRLVAGGPRRRARSAPACPAPARRSSRSPTRWPAITRIEAAFLAAAADTDLPGRVEVVAPRNAGANIV